MSLPIAVSLLLVATAHAQFHDAAMTAEPSEENIYEGCIANVCFALDGSSTISTQTYAQQKDLVSHVTRTLFKSNSSPRLSAVQYSVANHAISPLTDDESVFLHAVSSSQQVGGDGSFVTAGLNYCFSSLQHETEKTIVLLGDGRATIGSEPADRAKLFFSTGGQVLVAGVGDSPDMDALTKIAGGDSNRVFVLNEQHSIWQIVRRIVDSICN